LIDYLILSLSRNLKYLFSKSTEFLFHIAHELHFRLSNLFHGLGDKSSLKADVYLSLLKLSKDADLGTMVMTDLDQVRGQ